MLIKIFAFSFIVLLAGCGQLTIEDVKNGKRFDREKLNSAPNEVQLVAVQENGGAIQYIQNPDKELQLAAVQQNGYTIRYIKNPEKEVLLAAVQQNGGAIQYIQNPDKEVQLVAVQQNGYAIRYIKNPDKEVRLAAVKENGNAISDIKNPDKEEQLVAVQQNGGAIQYIQNPDREVQVAAVKQRSDAMQYIQNPDKELQLEAVTQDAHAIFYIQNPDKEVQLASKGSILATNKPLGHSVSNKEISIVLVSSEEIEFYGSETVKITNHTSKYVNIKSLSQYYCGMVTTKSDIRVPPKGTIAELFLSSKCKVYSMDQEVNYGFAAEYTIEEKSDSIYEQKNFTFSKLMR